MDATQRRTVALAAYAIAVVLFVFFFGRQFWAWADWHEAKNTLDFGLFKITSRPPFPNDARSVLLGLIAPIVLAAGGRVIGQSGRTK
ncbi:MAG TPA: hypothetical protein VI504_16835 [Candidatus Eisenbacteria bacterium]|jgi:hypothetical protein